MLTGDLVRTRTRSGRVIPTWIDPDRTDLVEPAEALLALHAQALERQWSRGELAAAVDEVVGTHRSLKVLRGFAKLLADRCSFDVDTPVEPMELRRRAFLMAREVGPLALEAGLLDRPTAGDVLERLGAELGITAEAVSAALYGDLKEAQILQAYRAPADATWLLNRYNVALAQAVLLRASEVTVEVHDPTVPRMRQLFRHVKFHQLMHHASRDGDLLKLVLDGPTSVLRQSTRYGMQLANFLPALLLQDAPWSLSATVHWTPRRLERTFSLDHTQGLRSHYVDSGAWTSQEQSWFLERWSALNPPNWALSHSTLPVDLGGQALVLPDFSFTDGTRTAHLEIVGYWRRSWLERRVALLKRYGPGNLILAVSKNLRAAADDLADFPGVVVPFGKIVPPKAILEAIEQVAR